MIDLHTMKSCFFAFFVLFSCLNYPLLASLVYPDRLSKPIHTGGCHGLEMTYGWSHNIHSGNLRYVGHFTPTLHTKVAAGFTNKSVFLFANTYHFNLWHSYESTYVNFLLGGQGSYKCGQISWKNIVRSDRLNMGIELGIELEKYLTDALLLLFTASCPLSFLHAKSWFSYRLSTGFGIAF